MMNLSVKSYALLRVFSVIATMMLVSHVACAQADFEKGYQAFQSYHGSDFDTVNLANGNLVLNIPLLSYEQRGGVPPVTISIRSNSTTFQSTPPLVSGPADTNQHEVASGVIGAPWGQPHVSISPGGLFWKEERIVTAPKTAIGPEYLVRFVAIDDSGATHSLGGGISNSTAGYVPNIKYSVDGSGLMLQPGTTATGPVLVDRKGNVGGMVDTNGNAIQLQGLCASVPGSGDYFDASLPSWEGYAHGTASATSISDTIGRSIPNPSYLPALQNSSCLVDIDASYHETTPVANRAFPLAYSPTTAYICPTVQLGGSAPGGLQYYANTYHFPGENSVTVPLTFCYAATPVSGSIPQVNGANLESETINENWWVLTSVELPNGTRWIFNYDTYGQVASVIMPTGGMVTYSYATRLACGNPPGEIPVVGTPVWPYSNLMSSRMVTQRNVYLNYEDIQNNIAPIEVWKYSNGIGSGWTGAPPAGTDGIASPGGPNSGQVTVTDTEGNATVHTFSLIGGSTCGPYETQTQYYQGSATLLKEVDTAYSYTGTDYANPTNFSNYIAVGVFPNLVTTTLPADPSPIYSQEQYTYDSFGSYQDYIGETHPFSFGLALSSSESDWSATNPKPPSPSANTPLLTTQLPALRTTQHTKQWQSSWNYYAANLIDLPCLDTIFSGSYAGTSPMNPQPTCTASAAAANQMAQTSYVYDQNSYSNCANGSAGNLTSVARWLQGSTNSPTTHTYYCSSWSKGVAAFPGMPQAKKDAYGNITQLQYDKFGLYLQQIQYPDQTSELPNYDDNTGLLESNTDVNGQITTYSYDMMRRLTSVTYPPGGGSESLSYSDTVGNLYVIFTKAIASNTTLVKEALADGLGRLTHTLLTSDPNGTIYTDTTYDNLGRVASVSNPYRMVGEATYGVTSYTYDALGRKAIVTAPDETQKQACFNGINTVGQWNCHFNLLGKVGSWEDDADEDGNDWQRTQNALGQMTYVAEPNGTSSLPSMETDYKYDVLNNLLSVNQWGGASGSSGARAARTFTYDSLSRLLTSSNPETGAELYNYQPNGTFCAGDMSLPCSRIDARGVTTTYQYDNMNRLWSKTYSGDMNGTPASCYLYGPQGAAGYGVGRLIDAWTVSASCGSSYPPTVPSFWTKRSIAYDPMGRIQSEQQYTPANVASGTTYAPAYSYDLAGDLISSTDGVTPTPVAGTTLTFTSSFDAAGRLQTLTSNWSDATHPATLFSAAPGKSPCANSSPVPSYAAFGGLMNAVYGSSLTLNRSYDNRLRTLCEQDTSSAPSSSTSGSATLTIIGQEQSK